jgi:hypothetical protein
MNILKMIALLVAGCNIALAQAPPPFNLKKLSAIPSERERCIYIVELADEHILGVGVKWDAVKPMFDLGLLDFRKQKSFLAPLMAPKPRSKVVGPNADWVVGQIPLYNWYVFLTIHDGVIVDFYLSNSGK